MLDGRLEALSVETLSFEMKSQYVVKHVRNKRRIRNL